MPAAARPPLPLLTQENAHTRSTLLRDLRSALPDEHIDLPENFTNQQLETVDVAIAANPPSSAFDALPALRWVQSTWAGVENMVEAAQLKNVLLVRLIDPALANAMAEAALAWTLFLHRRMPEYARLQRQHNWQQLSYRPAKDCAVTVLGLGELGRECAGRLASNGFEVRGWSSTLKSLPGVHCFAGEAQLAEVLAATDILIALLPLTPQTRHLLNETNLARLKPGSSLINFARGPIVNTQHLLQALDSGHIRHAVLDVFDKEPLPAESPLWQHQSVTVLPHIAAPTDPQSAARIVAGNIRRYRATGVIPEAVDLQKGF